MSVLPRIVETLSTILGVTSYHEAILPGNQDGPRAFTCTPCILHAYVIITFYLTLLYNIGHHI